MVLRQTSKCRSFSGEMQHCHVKTRDFWHSVIFYDVFASNVLRLGFEVDSSVLDHRLGLLLLVLIENHARLSNATSQNTLSGAGQCQTKAMKWTFGGMVLTYTPDWLVTRNDTVSVNGHVRLIPAGYLSLSASRPCICRTQVPEFFRLKYCNGDSIHTELS